MSSTTAQTQRPGTPFPHSHTLPHSPSTSRAWHYALSSRPLHFTLPALPTPTPPSLLKRQSSSGSNTSNSDRFHSKPSASPILAPTPRGVSTSSFLTSESDSESHTISYSSPSSAASPSMPLTPTYEPHHDVHIEHVEEITLAPPSTPFELPEAYFPTSGSNKGKARATPSQQSESQAEFEFEHGFPVAAFSTLSSTQYTYSYGYSFSNTFEPTTQRPTFKRRDTPRPVPTLATFSPVTTTGSSKPSRPSLHREEKRVKRQLTSVVDGGRWLVV